MIHLWGGKFNLSCKRENYVFYISDIDTIPDKGHFGKMDKEKEIAEHIKCAIKNCSVIKSTEYDGARISACSVGIVFPVHSYGISLAVYSFISSLNISKETYIYAVVTGEKYDVNDKASIRNTRNLDSFIRLFEKKNTGTTPDIYVRLKNMKRTIGGTEQNIRGHQGIGERIKTVMKGLVCYNLGELNDVVALPEANTSNVYNRAFDVVAIEQNKIKEKTQQLSNIFLDENILAGVRLCRVM